MAAHFDPHTHLSRKIPDAFLVETLIPNTGGLKLWLINADYPQHQLSAHQVEELMDDPPYWAFCWASGWVLAQSFMQKPNQVQNQFILDFGCGSGVVGISALLNGAQHVVFCDNDAAALAITRRNLQLNGIGAERYTLIDDYADFHALARQSNALVEGLGRMIVVADVFYDRDNLVLLDNFLNHFETVLVADSRLKGQTLAGLKIDEHWQASTIPDLHESADFNSVAIYSNV